MASTQSSNRRWRLTRLLDYFLQYALIALMFLMVVNVLWQIASRFLLGDPSSFTEELARFMLIWLALLGGVYAFRQGSNIGFDLLTSSLEPHLHKLAEVIAQLAVMLFSALALVIGGLKLMSLTFALGQTSAALGLPIGAVYSVIPLSGFLICIYALENLVHRLGTPVTDATDKREN